MEKRKIALIVFMILGVLDIAYGFVQGDQFSIFMGSLITAVAVVIMVREMKGAK